MSSSCNLQINLKSKNLLPFQFNSLDETQNSAQYPNTLCNPAGSFQSLSQKIDSIFSKMDADYQRKSFSQSIKLMLKSSQCSAMEDDSKADIIGHETQETFNSINSLILKSLIPFSETQNRNIEQQITFQNSASSSLKTNLTSTQSISSSQIQKSNESDLNQKETKFLLDLPLNESRCFLGTEQDENENSSKISTYQTIEKSKICSLKSSLQKRVTFQDLISRDAHQSLQLQQANQEVKVTNSESRYQLSFLGAIKSSKSILKNPQPFQFNQFIKQEKKDAAQTYQIDMDYFNIKNEELIKDLLDKEIQIQESQKKYFFSDLTTKISNSGEKKQKIIFITQNCFYVLEDLSSHKHTQKFDISDIKKIIIHSEFNNLCQINVRNTFQLNLQIKHFKQFILFIQSIFKCVLKTHLNIQQNQKYHLKEEAKINNTNNNNQFDQVTYLN